MRGGGASARCGGSCRGGVQLKIEQHLQHVGFGAWQRSTARCTGRGRGRQQGAVKIATVTEGGLSRKCGTAHTCRGEHIQTDVTTHNLRKAVTLTSRGVVDKVAERQGVPPLQEAQVWGVGRRQQRP